MILNKGIVAAIFGIALSACPVPAVAAENINVKVGFIRAPHMRETLSILDIPAADDGLAGATLAAEDNNTTGGFLGQSFTIEDVFLRPGDDPAAALNGLIAHGVSFVLADLPAAALLALSDAAKGKGVLIFNTSAPEDSLREENCRANVFHVAPSYSMLADGLAQYLVW
ncbi:MAG: ABC transporter substrate-binding protein, partial [Methylocella sp.]